MTVAGMLMAFDIDGTLVNEASPDDCPSRRTITAIRAIAEQGAIVSVATGRAAEDALAFARRHFPDHCMYVISGNGRSTVLASTGEAVGSTANIELAIDPMAIAVLSEGLRQVDPKLSTTVGLKTINGSTIYLRDRPNPKWVSVRWPNAPSVCDVVVQKDMRSELEAIGGGTSTSYLAVESALVWRGDDDSEGLRFKRSWQAFLASSATNRNAAAQLNVAL